MLVITIAVVLAVAVVRLLADGALTRFVAPRSWTRAAGLAALLAIVAGIAVSNPAKRWDEFKSVPAGAANSGFIAQHLASGSGSGRYQYWSAALDAFDAEPIRGIGAGAYEAWWDRYGSLSIPIRDAHSLFLESMAELGIVGLLLVVGWVGVALWSGISRAPRRWTGGELGAALALLAAGVVSAAIDWTWELPACFGLAVVAVGLLTGPASIPSTGQPVARGAGGGRSRGGLALGIATLLVACAAIWAGGVVFLAETRLSASRDSVDSGDLPAAAKSARDAIAVEPWASQPRLQLALVEELAGDLRGANYDVAQAIRRAPDDWRLWLVRTRLEVKSGNIPAATSALRRVQTLDPRAPFLRASG
jgi:hypothetical protein